MATYIGSKRISSKDDVKKLSRSEKRILARSPSGRKIMAGDPGSDSSSKSGSQSKQRYKPSTESTLEKLQSGEIKTSGDAYVVGGQVAASQKTAELVAAYKTQQRREFEEKKITKQTKTTAEYIIKQTRPYAPNYAQARMVKPPESGSSYHKPDKPTGQAVPTYSHDRLTSTLVPAVGYQSVVPVSYMRSDTQTRVYGSKWDKANLKVSETLIKNPVSKVYGGVVKPTAGKYIDWATSPHKSPDFRNTEYSTTLKQGASASSIYFKNMFNKGVYEKTYGVGGTREPKTVGQKASVMFGGAVIGATRYPIDKPVSFAGAMGLGGATAVGGGLITGIGSKSATVVKVASYGMGTVYGGFKLGQTVLEPSWAGKGMIVGETVGELAAFSGGSQLGGRALQTGKRYYYKKFGTKLTGSSEQFYTKQDLKVRKLTAKQTQTVSQTKPTGTKYTVEGIKDGKPFKMVSVQNKPGSFQDVYVSGKWGSNTFTGKIYGGKTTPVQSQFKYFSAKGDYLGSVKGNVPPRYLNIKEVGSVSSKPGFKSPKGNYRATAETFHTEYSGMKQTKPSFFSRTVETFKGFTNQKVNTVYESSPTARHILHKWQSYGDRFYNLPATGSRSTKIKFGDKLSSPADITIKKNVGGMVVDGKPTTKYSFMVQRGGELSITSRIQTTSGGQYSYSKGLDKVFLRNKLAAFLVSPVSGIVSPSGVTRGVTTPSTMTKQASFKPPKSQFRIEGFSIHKVVGITTKPITTLAPVSIFSRTKTRTPILTTRTRVNEIVSTTPITSSSQVYTPISETKPISITKTQPITKTKAITVTKTITTPTTQFYPTSYNFITTPIPPIPPPPPPPPGGLGFWWPSGVGGSRTIIKRKSLKQPKAYTPSGFSAAFGIKGKSSKIGVLSGLGIRPIKV